MMQGMQEEAAEKIDAGLRAALAGKRVGSREAHARTASPDTQAARHDRLGIGRSRTSVRFSGTHTFACQGSSQSRVDLLRSLLLHALHHMACLLYTSPS